MVKTHGSIKLLQFVKSALRVLTLGILTWLLQLITVKLRRPTGPPGMVSPSSSPVKPRRNSSQFMSLVMCSLIFLFSLTGCLSLTAMFQKGSGRQQSQSPSYEATDNSTADPTSRPS